MSIWPIIIVLYMPHSELRLDAVIGLYLLQTDRTFHSAPVAVLVDDADVGTLRNEMSA